MYKYLKYSQWLFNDVLFSQKIEFNLYYIMLGKKIHFHFIMFLVGFEVNLKVMYVDNN